MERTGLSGLDSHSCCVGIQLLWNFIMGNEIPSIGWEGWEGWARWAGPVRIGWEGWVNEFGLIDLYSGNLSWLAGWDWVAIVVRMDIVDLELHS